jgi:hypothetical protein
MARTDCTLSILHIPRPLKQRPRSMLGCTMKTLDLYVYDKDGDNLPQGRGIT